MIYNILEFPESENREFPEVPDSFLAHLPVWKRQEIERMKNTGSRQKRLLAWKLLEETLQKAGLADNLTDLGLTAGSHGKPRCREGLHLFVNISHCPAACACAAGSSPVGIDIERRFPFRQNLFDRICSQKEQELAIEFAGSSSNALNLCWSIKEAVLKMEGSGISYGMERADLSPLLHEALLQKNMRSDVMWNVDITGQIGGIGNMKLHLEQNERYTLAVCGCHEPICNQSDMKS